MLSQILATATFVVVAFGGLGVFYAAGPTFERWSEAQYGKVEDQ
jgi:hypothetical protein